MGYLTAADFKSGFDLRDYITEYESELRGDKLFISCPFHSDKTPSCLITTDHYYCFGCGANGDSIDFVMAIEGMSFIDVLRGADSLGFAKGSVKKEVEQRDYKEVKPQIVDVFNRTLLNRKFKIEYLGGRHIDLYTIQEANLGWGYPKNFSRFTSPRYTIPVYDHDGKLLTIRYRIDPAFDNGQEPKYLAHPKTPTGLYNSHILANNNEVLVVGSEFDAAFLYYRYDIVTISPPGENVFKTNWAELFTGKNVLIMLDNDAAGIKGAIHAHGIINLTAARTQIYRWPHELPNKYDIGNLVSDSGINTIDKILSEYDVEAYEN